MKFSLKLYIGAFYTRRSKLIIIGNSIKIIAYKLLYSLVKPLLFNILNYYLVD
jgi:hypothetical protein